MRTMGFEYADGKDDIALSINELVAEAADKAERLRESAMITTLSFEREDIQVG